MKRKRFAAWILITAAEAMTLFSGCSKDMTDVRSDGSAPSAVSEASSTTSGGETLPETGFCAVGAVDAAARTAKVLFSNGEIQTVSFAASAPPVGGRVNAYAKKGNEYAFEQPREFPPAGNVGNFVIYPQARQQRYYYNQFYFTDSETAVFVRYGPTSWRVFKGRGVIKNDTTTKAYIHHETVLDGLAKAVRYVMVVGDYAEEGRWPAATAETSKFLDKDGRGFESGDKDLS